ncbi:MAG: sugar transferase, partial [Novosphingobium sp.]
MPAGLPIGAIGVGRIGDRPTLIVNRGQLSLASRIKKRVVDLLFSAVALLILAPLLIAVAIAIKLDSPGPVLFRQLRVGYGNRPFEIYKFRSLRHEATDRDGNKSVSVGDSRVTRVGAFI